MEALQPHSAGLWVSDQLDTETPVPDNTRHKRQTSMPPAELKPAIPASEQPQIYALDHVATGISIHAVVHV